MTASPATTARDLYQSGRLADAIDAMNASVRQKPADINERGFLAELLCFAGNLDRADAMLDVIMKQEVSVGLGVSLFRQLIRAEQWRRQWYAEGRVPEFLGEPPAYLQSHIQAFIALREGRTDEAMTHLGEAEAARPAVAGTHNETPFDDIRDLDDSTANFFEVLTSTGKYYWVPMERVERIEFHPPERPRDLFWRRALMSVAEGPDGEVFIPAIYATASDDGDERVKLGRVTDWLGGDNEPVRGLGQRTLLVGDKDVPILSLGTLEFAIGEG